MDQNKPESAQQPSQIQMEIEAASAKEAFDPLAELKELKTGICLDMGMISLSRDEVKLMTLILSGRIAVDDIGSIVWYAMTSLGQDLNVQWTCTWPTKKEKHKCNSNRFLRPGPP